MRPLELLKSVGEFACMSSADLLRHPAWSLPVRATDGTEVIIRRSDAVPADRVVLNVRFGETHVLFGMSPCPAFPELKRVFGAIKAIPKAVLRAVCEKDARKLLTMLGGIFGGEPSVEGLAKPVAGMWSFRLEREDGADAEFSLELPDAAVGKFGTLERIDVGHPSVADLPVACETELAAFDLEQSEADGLGQGDYLLLPELDQAEGARIVPCGSGRGGAFRIVTEEKRELPFSQVLEGPESDEGLFEDDSASVGLELVRDNVKIASGILARLGDHRAMSVMSVFKGKGDL